jgi:membrane protease YdiL (CAAX protease family)
VAKKLRRLIDGLITIVGESAWVLFCFFLVAASVFGVLLAYIPPLENAFSTTVGQLLASGLIYALVVMVVILPIWAMRNKKYVLRILGVTKKPTRLILWLPLVLWAAYMGATIIAAVASSFLPWVDIDQAQENGFENLTQPYEYILAFVALVVLPPIAEELLFRGYLFGRLREKFGFWLTTAVVSVIFGLVHLQWNVGIDVAVLSVFLCYLRERTGSVWASMVLHAIKNGVAYVLLFIAPLIGFSLA